jgi:hypothetical protein
MKLLKDVLFEELLAQDLMMTYALNTDYILTGRSYLNQRLSFSDRFLNYLTYSVLNKNLGHENNIICVKQTKRA